MKARDTGGLITPNGITLKERGLCISLKEAFRETEEENLFGCDLTPSPPDPIQPPWLPSSALWRLMWSKNFVLLAYMAPQPGHATTFSWVWLRRCSRSLGRPLALASHSSKNYKNKNYEDLNDSCTILMQVKYEMYH